MLFLDLANVFLQLSQPVYFPPQNVSVHCHRTFTLDHHRWICTPQRTTPPLSSACEKYPPLSRDREAVRAVGMGSKLSLSQLPNDSTRKLRHVAINNGSSIRPEAGYSPSPQVLWATPQLYTSIPGASITADGIQSQCQRCFYALSSMPRAKRNSRSVKVKHLAGLASGLRSQYEALYIPSFYKTPEIAQIKGVRISFDAFASPKGYM